MTAVKELDTSIWLKPVLKSKDMIINCEKPRLIKYSEIQKGNIIALSFNNNDENLQERTFIAMSGWDSDNSTANFMNLYGNQIVISEKAFENLSVNIIGSLMV